MIITANKTGNPIFSLKMLDVATGLFLATIKAMKIHENAANPLPNFDCNGRIEYSLINEINEVRESQIRHTIE